jgi:hypothetical protein
MHEILSNAKHQLKFSCSFTNAVLQKYVESRKYTKMYVYLCAPKTHYTATVCTYVLLW